MTGSDRLVLVLLGSRSHIGEREPGPEAARCTASLGACLKGGAFLPHTLPCRKIGGGVSYGEMFKGHSALEKGEGLLPPACGGAGAAGTVAKTTENGVCTWCESWVPASDSVLKLGKGRSGSISPHFSFLSTILKHMHF